MNAHAPIAKAARACGLLLTAALAVPAVAAAAPTVNADLPCYTPGQPIGLSGAGYTPAGDVGLIFQLSGAHGSNMVAPKNPLKADAAGGIAARLPAPALASDNDLRETVSLTANDEARMGPTGPHRGAGGQLRGDAVPALRRRRPRRPLADRPRHAARPDHGQGRRLGALPPGLRPLLPQRQAHQDREPRRGTAGRAAT